MKSQKILFIVGPTAVGKSALGLKISRRLNGEIVSCDSMQVYKEINIASNKPSTDELKNIPHHLVNIISVCEDFNVAQFYERAVKAIEEIHKKKRVPIIVGGSGLYMQILLDGIFEQREENKNLRETLTQRSKKEGNALLYKELTEKDPKTAAAIHVNDTRRIVRALEVFENEEKPMSQIQKNRAGLWGKYDITIIGLNRERKELYASIDRRVEKMFEEGLVDEIRALPSELSKTAKGLIGIKEILGFLKGNCDLNEAKSLIQRNTRRFAKRQLTWFRKEKRIYWIEINNTTKEEDILREMQDKI